MHPVSTASQSIGYNGGLSASVNKTIVKPRVAAAVDRKTILKPHLAAAANTYTSDFRNVKFRVAALI